MRDVEPIVISKKALSAAQRERSDGAIEAQSTDPRPETLGQYTERLALRLAVPAGVLLALVIVVANWERNPVPMVGDWRAFGRVFVVSIIPLSLITGAGSFVLGTRAWNERVPPYRRRTWHWGVVPITAAYTLLLTAIAIASVLILDAGFRMLVLDKYQGAILAGAAGAALLFWMVKQVFVISVNRLLQTTIIIVVGGIYLTMANMADPLWWRESFSHLGTLESNTRAIFNATLVFAGIMFMVWLPYLMSDVYILVRHGFAPWMGARILHYGFVLVGAGMMVVGLVQYGISPLFSAIHNGAAYSISAAAILLMFGIRWLIPGLPREVFATSWLLMAGILVTLAAAAFSYFNTTGLEVVSFTLGMAWLQFLVRSVETHAAKLEPDAFPT